MSDQLMPYEKAGRVLRLLAWIQMVTYVVIVGLLVIAMFDQHKMPSPASILVFLSIVFPLFYLKVGKAVKEHKNWGRTAGIVMGILLLAGFPLGTIIGVYILWWLIKGWDQQPV